MLPNAKSGPGGETGIQPLFFPEDPWVPVPCPPSPSLLLNRHILAFPPSLSLQFFPQIAFLGCWWGAGAWEAPSLTFFEFVWVKFSSWAGLEDMLIH